MVIPIFILSVVLAIVTGSAPNNPSSAKPGLDAEPEVSPSVEVRVPIRAAELPPVVETARNVLSSDDFREVTGPRHPKVLWKATFRSLGLSWKFRGVAEDGTLYFNDLLAIRDGREQWAYGIPNDSVERTIAPDGRIWTEELPFARHIFVYNSRGEGGLIAGLTETPKVNKRETGSGYWCKTIKGQYYRYNGCDFGTISGHSFNLSGPEKYWTLKLDDTCTPDSPTTVDDDGDLLIITNAGTIYCINPQGRIRWTQKAGCQSEFISALGADDIVYGCGTTLHGLRARKPLWDLNLDVEPEARESHFDKSNTLYLKAKSNSSHFYLAVDNNGQLLWKLPFDNEPRPLALDKSGRLYLGVESLPSSTVMCLLD
jgi:hypothetical protein